MQNVLRLADRYSELRQQKRELDAQLKDTNAEIAKIERELVEQMVNEEMNKFDRNGQLFYLSSKLYASPKAAAKDKLFAWLKKSGYADMVKETVAAQTLSSFVKEQLDEHDVTVDDLKEMLRSNEIPEDMGELIQLAELLNIYEKTSVNVRKA